MLGELGRGGMGVVYKARQQALNRIVALKTIRGNRVGQKDLARFLVEAEAVAAIEHPNVVRVYAYGEHEGQPYMALEFLPGGTLAERIDRTGKLPPAETAQLVASVARGVAAAHALGIVHRDLKPANVLFAGTGERTSGVFSTVSGDASATPTAPNSDSRDTKPEPKVADFGLAKRGTSDLTQTQAVMGTPAYMAPEQADGKTKFVGPTADVWSLGVILYECLHGERPFQAPDVHGLLGMIRSAELPQLDSHSRIPRELDLICRKCLEKNPADRYPSAAEFADDLERYTRGEPVTVRPLSSAARGYRWAKRNPVVSGLLGAVFLISVGLVISLFAQYRQAVARAESEHNAKVEADGLAAKNAALAEAETERRKEAERLKRVADTEAARANEVSNFMTGLFRGSDPLDMFGEDILPQSWEKQRVKTTEVLLRDAAERFKTELKGQPLARAKLLTVVANSMTNLGITSPPSRC
ncbi:MAG: serine/threonine-protein kinase [Gemmataceae bacterium]